AWTSLVPVETCRPLWLGGSGRPPCPPRSSRPRAPGALLGFTRPPWGGSDAPHAPRARRAPGHLGRSSVSRGHPGGLGRPPCPPRSSRPRAPGALLGFTRPPWRGSDAPKPLALNSSPIAAAGVRGSVHFSADFALAQARPLVVELLAARQAQFQLR